MPRLLFALTVKFFRLVYRVLTLSDIIAKRVVFTSYPDVSDNALAMFLYLRELPKRYDIVWLVDDNSPRILAKYDGAHFLKRRSLKGIFALATARVVFHTHGLPRFVTRRSGQVIVNLWHGMPLKRISALQRPLSSVPISDYSIATSQLFQSVLARAFLLNTNRVLITGQPRNDVLFAQATAPKLPPLWLPTFRHSNLTVQIRDSLLSPEEFCGLLKRADAELAANNLQVTLKLHPMDALNQILSPNFNAINLIYGDDQTQGVESLMASSVALITDYSSAAIDYLVLKRPVGYFCPDLAGYTRGFIEEVETAYFAAGTMLDNIDDLICFVANPRMRKPHLQTKLVDHFDNGSSARLWQQLQNLEGPL